MDTIDPAKDVDGFHPTNTGLLAQKRPGLRPCTPWGVIRLAKEYQLDLTGLRAVVVGASNIVGRPMALELLLARSTVTVCHTGTRDLRGEVERAELVVAAVGKAAYIPGDGFAKARSCSTWASIAAAGRQAVRRRGIRGGGGTRRLDHARARRRGADDHRHACFPIPWTRRSRGKALESRASASGVECHDGPGCRLGP